MKLQFIGKLKEEGLQEASNQMKIRRFYFWGLFRFLRFIFTVQHSYFYMYLRINVHKHKY